MSIYRKYINQTRKPQGFLGKMMIRRMNSEHAKLSEWGLEHLARFERIAPAEILEIGCGGGMNAGALMKMYPSAKLTAIDYSEVSVGKATAYNKAMIASGRCVIRQGDVSALDLPEENFDLATAFETIYFWPGLENCFSEVARVLNPGGFFMIVNESDGEDERSLDYAKIIDGMRCYTPKVIEAALKSAGFTKVRCSHHRSMPWITVLARK